MMKVLHGLLFGEFSHEKSWMASQRASLPKAGPHDTVNLQIWVDFRLLLVELKLAALPTERPLALVTCENFVLRYESEYSVHGNPEYTGGSRLVATMQGLAVQDMYTDRSLEHFLFKLRKGRSNTGADAVEISVSNLVSYSDYSANSTEIAADLNTRIMASWAPVSNRPTRVIDPPLVAIPHHDTVGSGCVCAGNNQQARRLDHAGAGVFARAAGARTYVGPSVRQPMSDNQR